MNLLKPDEIEARRSELNGRLAEVDAEIEKLSLASISGDAAADERLTELTAEKLKLDREGGVLEKALNAAKRLANSNFNNAMVTVRAANLAVAVKAAKRVLVLSEVVEHLQFDLMKVCSELDDLEKIIRTSTSAAEARDLLRDGSSNLSAIAIDQFASLGRHLSFRERRNMSTIMAGAFRDLLDRGDEEPKNV